MDETSAETDDTPAEGDGWEEPIELNAFDEDGAGKLCENVKDVKDGNGSLRFDISIWPEW